MTRTEHTRFWSKVKKGSGCWLWTGAKIHSGYGQLSFRRKRMLAHRLSWSCARKGRKLSSLFILHRCDNPPCVRPSHLFQGTHQDNVADRDRKGRVASGLRHASHTKPLSCARGEKIGTSKLKRQQVEEIKNLLEVERMSQREIACKFGVCQMSISNIATGRTWKKYKTLDRALELGLKRMEKEVANVL